MGFLRVALRTEFENPVVLVHSCVPIDYDQKKYCN